MIDRASSKQGTMLSVLSTAVRHFFQSVVFLVKILGSPYVILFAKGRMCCGVLRCGAVRQCCLNFGMDRIWTLGTISVLVLTFPQGTGASDPHVHDND